MRGILLILCLLPMLAGAAEPTAGAVIETFYRSYLPTLQGTPPLSKSFAALIAENRALCAQYSPNEICGFGADADPYLNAQDYADGMTFENTRATVTESSPGNVVVTLRLFPDDETSTREIAYRLIREDGHWVVDDIDSARAAMMDEITMLRTERH